MNERDIQILMDTAPEGALDAGWQSGVLRQRAKTIKAGRHLYLDSYPIWDTRGEQIARDRAQEIRRKNRDAVDKANRRRAQRKLEILLNANFGAGDILATCTYSQDQEPQDARTAARDMTNMIARLRRIYDRLGKVLKYVYVTEMQRTRRGERYHHHLILSEGPSREQVEACWQARRKGQTAWRGICNTRRAQRLPEGLTGWAKYITKSATGYGKGQEIATRHKWCASKNLTQPSPRTADKKISRRRVEQIASDMSADQAAARAALEKLHPGYTLLECRVRTSQWVTGAYISAIMVRQEDDSHGKRIFDVKNRVKQQEGCAAMSGGNVGRKNTRHVPAATSKRSS